MSTKNIEESQVPIETSKISVKLKKLPPRNFALSYNDENIWNYVKVKLNHLNTK